MTQAFLRRAPKPGARRRVRIAGRVAWLGATLLVLGMLNARGGARVTQLTREIQEAKSTILTLESELGYVLRLEGAVEGREIALGVLERRSGFAAPDSGCVVMLEPTDERR
jgi:hypothetical protein